MDAEVFGEESSHWLGLWQKRHSANGWVPYTESLVLAVLSSEQISFDAHGHHKIRRRLVALVRYSMLIVRTNIGNSAGCHALRLPQDRHFRFALTHQEHFSVFMMMWRMRRASGRKRRLMYLDQPARCELAVQNCAARGSRRRLHGQLVKLIYARGNHIPFTRSCARRIGDSLCSRCLAQHRNRRALGKQHRQKRHQKRRGEGVTPALETLTRSPRWPRNSA
jgi:hypothetical protein